MKRSLLNTLRPMPFFLMSGLAFAAGEPGPECTGEPLTALRAARLVRGNSVRYPYSADYTYLGVRIASAQRSEWFRECISDGGETECSAWMSYQSDGRYPLFNQSAEFSFYLGASAGIYDVGMYAELLSNTGYEISAKRVPFAEVQGSLETIHRETSYGRVRLSAPVTLKVLSNCAKSWTSLKFDERDFGDGVKTWREHSMTLLATY